MRYILIALVFLFISCRGPRLSATTMEGITGNAKAGAVLIVPANGDSVVYYIDGLSHWLPEQVGKKIRVSGRLEEKYTKPLRDDEEEMQMIAGYMRIIRKPKWEFLH